jgi:hypothetical protein
MILLSQRSKTKTDINDSRVDPFIISTGKLFHKLVAVTLNKQSTYDFRLDTDAYNNIWLNDPSFRDDLLMDTCSYYTDDYR